MRKRKQSTKQNRTELRNVLGELLTDDKNIKDLSENIYLNRVTMPFGLENDELKKFAKTIEILTKQKIEEADLPERYSGIKLDFFAEPLSFSVSYLMQEYLEKEYNYINMLKQFSISKNVIGDFLIFKVSDNKYELNISKVTRQIEKLIGISELTSTLYDALNRNRKQKKPRLNDNDISLIAYRLTIRLYLRHGNLSVRKACTKVFNNFDKEFNVFKNRFSEFDSYKQSFIDWCGNERNQNKYPEIKEFLTEKDKRIATRQAQKKM